MSGRGIVFLLIDELVMLAKQVKNDAETDEPQIIKIEKCVMV